MTNDGVEKEAKRKIIGILKVLFPGAKIYLYGSRARGDFREYSDIDLAIDAGKESKRLNIGEAKSVMENLSMPYKVDIVDLNHISEHMHQVITKEGILWNE